MASAFKFTDEEYDYVIKKTTEYANAEYESSKEKRFQRNQNNKNRIIQQNITGKIGEFAAMFYLLDKGNQCSCPDTKVYTGNFKSFDADLTLNGRPLHVKSQSKESSDYFNCVSWTFQRGGKGMGHTDPLTKKSSNDLVIFCHVNGKMVNIYGPYNWFDVKKLLRDPLLERLRGIKQCIYLEDLKKI